MKILAIILVLIPEVAWSQAINHSDRQSVAFEQNYIKNGGGENGTYGWSASGGSISTSSTASMGYRSILWDSNASNQTLDLPIIGQVAYLGTAAMDFICRIMAASGTATHKLSLYNVTNSTPLTEVTVTSSTTSFQDISVYTNWDSSKTIYPRITSVAANEPGIYIDECRLTRRVTNSGTNETNNFDFIGSAFIATTAGCAWTRNNTALGAFGTDTDCPGPTVEFNPGPGTIQTTDTDLPRFTVNNLEAGFYEVRIDGMIGQSGTTTTPMSITISDGTTMSGRCSAQTGGTTGNDQFPCTVTGYFLYASSGNRSFEVYGSNTANDIALRSNADNQRVTFSIKRLY